MIKTGALDDLPGGNGLARGGLKPGVKAGNRAFTLVELLMVIANLAILAAVLLPVLNRARQTKLEVQCMNDFKQLQTSYHMYVDDNNGYLPLNNLGSGTGISSWIAYTTPSASAQNAYNTLQIRQGALYQYNQNVRIYVCPANNYLLVVGADGGVPPYRDDSGNILREGQQIPETRTCSIEYSMGSGGGNTPPWVISSGAYTWHTYQKLSSLQPTRVATKIVFVDEASGSVDDGVFALWPMNTQNYWWNVPTSRHDRGGIFSFADGHVEYYKWHGSAVPTSYWQNQGPGNNGIPIGSTVQLADSSDDLPRVQAGGPQFP